MAKESKKNTKGSARLGEILAKLNIFRGLSGYMANKNVRRRMVFTIAMVVLYRFLANVPPAGIDVEAFSGLFKDNPLTSIFSLATGGSLDNPSLVMIGLGAYINASIIIQLLSTVIPKLEELSKEGARGRLVLSNYTRYLTIPLSILQAVVIYIMLSRSAGMNLISQSVDINVITFVASITAGSLFLMWIGDMITENGIGNGSSIIISLSILSSLPKLLVADLQNVIPIWESYLNGSIGFFDMLSAPSFMFLYAFLIGLILLVVLIVLINEGIRKIRIQYARRTVGTQDNYLPIRVTQAGVMPIIFASAMLTFPGIISQLLGNSLTPGSWGDKVVQFIINSPLSDFSSWEYNAFYFVLIIAFTFFYTFVISKPADTADNLKKSGAFIPGIRPGKTTEKYIIDVMIRLTTVGSIFLALLAVIPSIARIAVSNTGNSIGILSGIGGTSLLIMISVFLQTHRQLESMKVTKSYDQYR